MTVLERIASLWFALLEHSAGAAADLTARVAMRRRLIVAEREDHELLIYREGLTGGPPLGRIASSPPGAKSGGSALLRRSHVTLELDPRHFVFRSIDLPGRARDFIEPIVKAQIDRLTPWRPDQVLFGWSEPSTQPDGSVAVMVAATDRALVMPLISRAESLGAAVVVARVSPRGESASSNGAVEKPLVVARINGAAFSVVFWRRFVASATAIVTMFVIGSTLYAQVVSFRLDAEADDLERQSVAKRALVATAIERASGPASEQSRLIDRRKQEVPFATLVLDAVSRILPDNSYATTFDITGTRLQLVGFTTDAPALIRLFNSSELFENATFFAPTTRLPDDTSDRFNIEATIRPQAFPR